jgi:hypothetical protein
MSAFSGERDKVGRDDMVEASISSDAEILANLKKRLASSIIFTSIGSVILSVNPFKNLGVFNQDVINKYKAKQAFEVPPHIFTLAESAYRNLLTEERSQAVVISGESGAGKCLARGTPVLAADGAFRPVESLRVGDRIVGDDNAPRTVLALATGREQMARILRSNLDDHATTELFRCNLSHILTLALVRDLDDRHRAGDLLDISVRDFLALKPDARASLKGLAAPPLDFDAAAARAALPVDPYLLGLWLGDGGAHNNMQAPFVVAPDAAVAAWLERAVGGAPHADATGARRCFASAALAELVHANDLWPAKRVPQLFKCASRDARRALLAGLVDADALRTKRQFELRRLQSAQLAADVAFVARSLGLSARQTAHGLLIAGDGVELLPCLRARNQLCDAKRAATSAAHSSRLFDIAVEVLPEDEYFGFTLDGNKRFIVGDEFVVTHNTEAAKGVLEFIAAVSGGAGDTTIAAVKRVFLESNPIAETFGNAKTVRNNNSSRFGKYFEIQFQQGTPVGGRIRVFLLEKTRCTGPSSSERNFHSFYQVFHHAQARNWKLSKPADFRILASGALTVEGINDGKDFQETTAALGACQIQPADLVWQIVAGLLHLGNVTFRETPKGCEIVNMDACNTAAQLLGLPVASLQTVLCFRSISSASARATVYNKPNTVAEANAARDALLCGIYEKLFLWLIEAINRAMATRADGLTISILDIFGFENFDGDGNGFAQLAINYLNEALQKLFTDLTLKSEQAEYAAEGIPWTHIEFRNNDPQMQLIIGKPLSIFKCLDDAVLFGGAGTDESFLKALYKNFATRECFACEDPQQGGKHFVVRHYAGDVSYFSVGFIDANRDRMLDEMRDLMSISTVPIIVQSFSAAPAVVSPRGGGGAVSTTMTSPRSAVVPPRGGGAAGGTGPRGGVGGKQRPPNVSVQFQKSAHELLQALYASNPCYIRCLKSNDTRTPLGFDDARMLQQVRYLGLSEQIRVRRAGYAHRVSYERFNKRYGLCHDNCYPTFAGAPRDGTTLLLDTMGISNSTYTYGKTKLFIRDPKVLTDVETYRVKRLELFGQQVAAFKVPKKPVEQGNLLLELIKNLILPELGQFKVARIGPNGEDLSVTYQAYQAVLSAYTMGEVQGTELQSALVQLLLDVTEVLKLHVVQQQKKGGWLKAFKNFFSRSKTPTA